MRLHGGICRAALTICGAMMCADAFAQASPERKSDPAFDRYAAPATLVMLPGGRTLNLDCRGAGAPTILLFAGLTGWSEVWVKVHDSLAAHRRVCAFDPAGFGHSGPSTSPQDAAHIAADLDAALKAEKVTGPFILVGHSAGGLQALAFTDRRRRDIAGMVLVDPSYPGQNAEGKRIAPNILRFFRQSDQELIASFERCAQALEKGPIPSSAPDAALCFDFHPGYSEKLRTALAAVESPARMRTKIAQFGGIYSGADVANRSPGSLGAMPLIVLTRGRLGPPPGMPAEVATEGPALGRAWIAAHAALAKLSLRGEQRHVAEAGHMVQLDRPDAVITAIDDVVRDTKAMP